MNQTHTTPVLLPLDSLLKMEAEHERLINDMSKIINIEHKLTISSVERMRHADRPTPTIGKNAPRVPNRYVCNMTASSGLRERGRNLFKQI